MPSHISNPGPQEKHIRPHHVLVWLSGALGDTLLGYPALAALRAWAPAAQVTAVGRPPYLAFARRAGLIDAVADADGPIGQALFSSREWPAAPPPDLAIVWSAAYETVADRLVTLGVRSIIAAPPRPVDVRHQARYLLDCLLPLGVPRALHAPPTPPAGPAPPFLEQPPASAVTPDAPMRPLSQAQAQPATEVARSVPFSAVPKIARSNLPSPDRSRRPEHQPDSASSRAVLLHPGAGARWKRWPLAHMLVLAERLTASGYRVCWSCGSADDDLRAALVPSGALLWPNTDLDQFAAALPACRLIVSPDTGVAHLAALLDVPQVVLFGPTDPRRWRPIGRQVSVVRAPDRCGGEWATARDAAALPHLLRRCRPVEAATCRCLEDLLPETVFAECLERLSRSGTPPR